MAVTVTQEPNDYNLVVQPQVWTLSGLTTEDRYVLIVRDSGSNIIATIKQPANPAGVAHFDISKILQAQMGTSFYETITQVSDTPGESFKYFIQFGTETNGTIDLDGGSSFKWVYNGWDNWRVLNWDDTDYNPVAVNEFSCESSPPLDPITGYGLARTYNFLTNYPKESYTIRSSSYHTLAFINRLKETSTVRPNVGVGEAPAYVRIKLYNIVDALIQTVVYSIDETNGLGPKPTYNTDNRGMPAYVNSEYVGAVGVGPQNLIDAGYWSTPVDAIWNTVTQTWGNYAVIWNYASAWATVHYYTVEIWSEDACKVEADGPPANETATELQDYFHQLMYEYRFDIADPCSKFDPVTVSFVNQYGVKDYFTFDRRNTYNTNTKRQEYFKTIGTWSDSTYSIDQHSGGSTVFSSDITTNMSLSSNWMDDDVSKWLEELYTSPSVQVYYDGEWNPAIITSNTYEQKSYSRNKMFQHNLDIKFANKKRVQRG